VVSDLHLERVQFCDTGRVAAAYDTAATLGRLTAVIARHDPGIVIALGDSFQRRSAPDRLSVPDRDTSRHAGARDWIWISGNHDPALPSISAASSRAKSPLARSRFARATGAAGESPAPSSKACVATRARWIERRCFVSDGERAVMPAFAPIPGLEHPRRGVCKNIPDAGLMAHVLGDTAARDRASRCY